MKIYLAGPMRSYEKYNFAEFFRITDILFNKFGHIVRNPAQMDLNELYQRKLIDFEWNWNNISEEEFMKVLSVFTLEECLRRDIQAITECDAVVFMSGWRRSEGANKELAVAKMLGLKLYEWIDEQMVVLKEEAVGRKFDGAKPRWDLLDTDYAEGTVVVLTKGSVKYSDNNWKKVEKFMDTYYSALMRHIQAIRRKEYLDKETGELHTSHASCCLMFIDWKIRRILKGEDIDE